MTVEATTTSPAIPMVKRKADALGESDHINGRAAKKAAAVSDTHAAFAPSLFSIKLRTQYRKTYASSTPYKHAVVSPLIADNLLRAVREEVIEHVNFTPKETDIYKIHQSGDLANLSALESSALEKLPSLLKLRDSLYSPEFRQWIAEVADSGPLSGKKTDMAINVYVPGCHLLCHDDVIGTRRVSYILYLTDPDEPWQARWGGALRLHSTDEVKGEDGKTYKIPRAEWEKSIAPAWNQLSFFTVQPGESFHDVEEVYHKTVEDTDDGRRVRMAISGWFHIPQEGEEGYQPGLEEQLAERSSLAQLQGKADQLDEPQTIWFDPANRTKQHGKGAVRTADDELSEDDLQFLIKYITPDYLTPDTVEQLNEMFVEESTVQLTDFLSKKFSARLQAQLISPQPKFNHSWKVSRPPHKHRFEYMVHGRSLSAGVEDAYCELLHELLPSLAFRKWLALVTGLELRQSTILARHFRRGLDYQLAQEYNGDAPQLEYTLCVTPSSGWIPQEEGGKIADDDDDDNVGGYELFMAGEDIDAQDSTSHVNASSQTGAGNRRSAKNADPAIYQAAQEGEDDGILFSNPATWNTLSLVLRDKGVLRFVKYVSRAAPGDRWDFSGAYEVEQNDDEDAADEEADFEGFAD
ncbi:hypothetical protein AMS68_000191 [Peltaster fructicola]|uniref:uS12 prolyl 3,4-dihydroxylase n=1 Tax=Peltaster fructicola TaxID=286661 RepID=A0A6H0XIY6_9PEZI|nr:hypothetical protein AMS68_000191 [Peltaster fructicola]